MPDAVQTFVNTRQMDEVLRIQRDIVRSYEDDMVKYADSPDRPHIKQCFQSIPRQLSKENKKFQYSVVKKGATAAKYAGSLKWIEDAGIILRCHNVSITELPLSGNAQEDIFKVYMQDIGLLVSMLEDGTQYDILTGNVKSTKTILGHPEKYHVYNGLKLGDYNIGRVGQILVLPLYLAFLLREF